MPFLALILPLLSSAWSFVKAHWRPFALAGALVVAFIGGRCSAPKPALPAVTQKATSDTHQVEQKHAEAVEQKTAQKDEQKVIRVVRDRVTQKDGTVDDHTETTETIGTETHEAEATKTTNDDHTETTQHVETVTVVTPAPLAPKWFAGLDLGVPVSLKAPFAGTPFLVLHLDRALPKPRWLPLTPSVGLWGSLDVKGQSPAAGLSFGVGF
jgi:hypothetical protein